MSQEHADKRRVRIVGAASTLNHPENESRQRDRDGIGARSGLADFVELLAEVRSERKGAGRSAQGDCRAPEDGNLRTDRRSTIWRYTSRCARDRGSVTVGFIMTNLWRPAEWVVANQRGTADQEGARLRGRGCRAVRSRQWRATFSFMHWPIISAASSGRWRRLSRSKTGR